MIAYTSKIPYITPSKKTDSCASGLDALAGNLPAVEASESGCDGVLVLCALDGLIVGLEDDLDVASKDGPGRG